MAPAREPLAELARILDQAGRSRVGGAMSPVMDALESRLRRHVATLAGEIGERRGCGKQCRERRRAHLVTSHE